MAQSGELKGKYEILSTTFPHLALSLISLHYSLETWPTLRLLPHLDEIGLPTAAQLCFYRSRIASSHIQKKEDRTKLDEILLRAQVDYPVEGSSLNFSTAVGHLDVPCR